MGTIVFLTYPPMFEDYERDIENAEYDNQLRAFEVPVWWAVDFIFLTWRMSLEAFLNEYTWDDTYEMYEQAIADDAIVSEEIIER